MTQYDDCVVVYVCVCCMCVIVRVSVRCFEWACLSSPVWKRQEHRSTGTIYTHARVHARALCQLSRLERFFWVVYIRCRKSPCVFKAGATFANLRLVFWYVRRFIQAYICMNVYVFVCACVCVCTYTRQWKPEDSNIACMHVNLRTDTHAYMHMIHV